MVAPAEAAVAHGKCLLILQGGKGNEASFEKVVYVLISILVFISICMLLFGIYHTHKAHTSTDEIKGEERLKTVVSPDEIYDYRKTGKTIA